MANRLAGAGLVIYIRSQQRTSMDFFSLSALLQKTNLERNDKLNSSRHDLGLKRDAVHKGTSSGIGKSWDSSSDKISASTFSTTAESERDVM